MQGKKLIFKKKTMIPLTKEEEDIYNKKILVIFVKKILIIMMRQSRVLQNVK